MSEPTQDNTAATFVESGVWSRIRSVLCAEHMIMMFQRIRDMNAVKEAKLVSFHVKTAELKLEIAEVVIERKMVCREIQREERKAEDRFASYELEMAAMEEEKAETIAFLRQNERQDDTMIEEAGGPPRKK
jgi:hypothetical protein